MESSSAPMPAAWTPSFDIRHQILANGHVLWPILEHPSLDDPLPNLAVITPKIGNRIWAELIDGDPHVGRKTIFIRGPKAQDHENALLGLLDVTSTLLGMHSKQYIGSRSQRKFVTIERGGYFPKREPGEESEASEETVASEENLED